MEDIKQHCVKTIVFLRFLCSGKSLDLSTFHHSPPKAFLKKEILIKIYHGSIHGKCQEFTMKGQTQF